MRYLIQVAALLALLVAPTVHSEMQDLTNSIGMQLKLIPAGRFVMGSAEDGKGASSYERPSHQVKISRPYCLGVYEVTNAQWKQVMAPSLTSRALSCSSMLVIGTA